MIVVTQQEPPAPQAETVPPAPESQVHEYFVWEPGHWFWTGLRYIWIPGHYMERPYQAAVWIPGAWTRDGLTWTWTPGHWS